MLYHGSVIGGLTTIWARSKSHATGEKVAYFTLDRVYALVCCRKQEENFVTMGPDKSGRQHYFERFPDQLKVLYFGKEGFLYKPISEEGLVRTKGNSYESQKDVPVVLHEHVLDVYEEILNEERMGNVIIHRYDEIDPQEQKENAIYIREHVDDEGPQMRTFYIQHFSQLWA